MGILMRPSATPVRSLSCILFLVITPCVCPGQVATRATGAPSGQALQPLQDGEVVWFGDEEPPLLVQPGQMAEVYGVSPMAPQMPGQTQPHWGTATQRSPWHWQWLPDGLIFPGYMASGRESRMGSVWSFEKDHGWLWDVALGGHVGIARYGDDDPDLPYGWQLDMEGAAFPRLDLDSDRQMMCTDFRFGVPLSVRQGCLESKLAYYHLSSHLGDDFLLENPGYLPVNYVRDTVVWAVGLRIVENIRAYAEAGYAFYRKGGSEPWEFQFGVDWSRVRPDSFFGSPFFAVNGRIREEVDFGGNLTAQVGWQRRGEGGNLLRLGFQYFNGKTDAYQFFNQHEEQFGIGLWYDF